MSDSPPCYSGSTRETPLGSVVSLEASDRLTDLATWGSLTDTSFPAIFSTFIVVVLKLNLAQESTFIFLLLSKLMINILDCQAYLIFYVAKPKDV